MTVYIVMLLLSTAFAILATRLCDSVYSVRIKSGYQISIKQGNIFAFMSFLPLALVSALRVNVGVDYNSYAWIFNAINTLGEKTHVEKGYELLNQAVGVYTNDYKAVFFICSVITIGFFVFAIKENSANFAMSIYLFVTLGYFFYAMNSIRHFIALSIYLFAFRYMKKQKFLPFLALILVAACFHKIALIAIPVYFLLTRKFKFSYYVIIAIFLAIAAVLNKQILNIIFSVVYQSYRGSVYNVFTFSVFNVLLSAVACFFAIAYYKPLLEKSKSNIILINAAIFMLLFYLFCGWIPTPTRIGHFGTIFFILLFPEAISLEKNKKVRLFYWIVVSIFAAAFMFIMLADAARPEIQLLPYNSVFSS